MTEEVNVTGKQGLVGAGRRRTILRTVQESSSVSVAQLCAMLGVSVATVRRDLVAFAKRGVVEWVYGGILAPVGGAGDPHVLGEKAYRRGEKAEITQTALSFISPEVHSVLLEASMTIAQLGPLLCERRGPVFLADSPEITLELVAEGLEVTLVGGQLRAYTLTTVGLDTDRQIDLFRADIAFIGVNAIGVGGLSLMNATEAEMKTAIIMVPRAVITLGDHSRLGKRGLAHVARADAIDTLVVDVRTDDVAVEALRSCGLGVIITEG